ncbi:hypothetical protein D9Q98_004339 [Chlorella vulgaris]|uniref:Uncharacterized protein n=1 Tax=Chlorella vulgaris TaxID=3077 RepID=A0A9D4TPF4_CHLVU|nr:hypothetical protein D9Q98_004339 [Chlorella vulgaris]
MRSRLAIALALAACTVCAFAQDATTECEAPLAEMLSKLSDAQARLAAAEASGGSCTAEAAELKAKLQQLEDSVSSSDQAAADLAAKLEATQAQLAAAPDAATVEQIKAAAAAAEARLAEAERQLAAKEGEASGAQANLLKCGTNLQSKADEFAALRRSAEEASTAVGSCSERQQALEAAVAEARAKAEALEAAWLPPWAATRVVPALTQAQELALQYTAQGHHGARYMWHTHGKPTLDRSLALAQSKAAQLNAAIESKAGDSWPKFKAGVAAASGAAAKGAAVAAKHAAAAAAAGKKAALVAWNSEAVALVRPTLVKVGGRVAAQAQLVQRELEELLISLLAKNNNSAPLARRPYVTYMVYAALVVPLVAFGMPLLGLRRSARQPAESNLSSGGHPMSTKRRKKPAPKAH